MQEGKKGDKTGCNAAVTYVDKGAKCTEENKRRDRKGSNSKTGSTFHEPGAGRTRGGISRGGGEREMFHGAVMPTERALNVFNIT